MSPAEAQRLRDAMARARAGQASLGELGAAADLAARHGLPGCAGELRGHVRAMVAPSRARSVGRDVLLGLATGTLTHYLLRGL